ncbi:hypothetical protein [Bacillus phage PM1]|uniref:Siphovirus Gp157 family protein n=1 Tax=Bacillus phage PM1 TaxID=547228 RepID=M4ZRG4_9CAUD|nr:Mu Gam-like end protection [Bacillus phage PM1]BAM99086.1 hypothetical protein [Bacillus phage PM1]
MNLYDLTGQYLTVLNMADELEDDTLKDTLDAIKEPMDEKAGNIAGLIKSFESEIEMIKAEEKRLAERRKSRERKIVNLRDMLKDHVLSIGEDNGKTTGINLKNNPRFSRIWVQKNPPSAQVKNVYYLPEEYQVPQEPKADVKQIIKDWKDGKINDNQLNEYCVSINQSESVRFK